MGSIPPRWHRALKRFEWGIAGLVFAVGLGGGNDGSSSCRTQDNGSARLFRRTSASRTINRNHSEAAAAPRAPAME